MITLGETADGVGRGEGSMGEEHVAAMAAAAWIGALAAWPFPALLPAGVGVAALVARRPLLLVVAVGLLAAALGNRAEAAYQPLEPRQLVGAPAVLLDDPRPFAAGWAATLRLEDGSRVQTRAWGGPGFGLSTLGGGDHVTIDGRLAPIEESSWARSRHLVGRVQLDSISPIDRPPGLRSVVEGVRDRIVAGAGPLPESMRPLYLGLVVGEDRFQPPDQRARFGAAGLSHLLAVSGQNVAFVLALLRPVVFRFGRRSRFVVTVAVLAGFAVATRLEPSVMRATVVAGLAAWSALGGHRQSGLRLLGLAVTALILIDPFLVHSIGFQLSVAASCGILLLGPVIAKRVPLPEPIAGATAVTVSAQIAVVPIIGRIFGPVSIVSVPANLLGGWAAGVVMMWGLTVGVVAGAVGGWFGALLQGPSAAAMWWLDEVAAFAARVPAPAFTGSSMLAVAALVGAARLLSGRADAAVGLAERSFRRAFLTAVLAAVLVATLAAIPEPPRAASVLDGGGWFLPSEDGAPSFLLIRGNANDALLDAIVAARITAIDVVVVESGGGGAASVARATARLVPTGVILAPPLHRIVGGTRVTREMSLVVGETTLTIRPERRRLTVSGDPIGPP
ncbi:MAG: ComEC/Rec2 family competence protein [Acidimicrobiales bacterium]